jgi:hypothetical protein
VFKQQLGSSIKPSLILQYDVTLGETEETFVGELSYLIDLKEDLQPSNSMRILTILIDSLPQYHPWSTILCKETFVIVEHLAQLHF